MLDAVDVVNHFIASQSSPKFLFDFDTMLFPPFVFASANADVAEWIYVPPSLKRRGRVVHMAAGRTEFVCVPFLQTEYPEDISASPA